MGGCSAAPADARLPLCFLPSLPAPGWSDLRVSDFRRMRVLRAIPPGRGAARTSIDSDREAFGAVRFGSHRLLRPGAVGVDRQRKAAVAELLANPVAIAPCSRQIRSKVARKAWNGLRFRPSSPTSAIPAWLRASSTRRETNWPLTRPRGEGKIGLRTISSSSTAALKIAFRRLRCFLTVASVEPRLRIARMKVRPYGDETTLVVKGQVVLSD
jgi:hypothetical protein